MSVDSDTRIEYLVQYPDEEGRTCYSKPFINPIEAYLSMKALGERIVVKRSITEENFDSNAFKKELERYRDLTTRRLKVLLSEE